MTVRMSKVSQLILHILHTSLIATIVFFYHHLKYCFCKCYSYPCFYFLTLWVRNASCFAGNVTGWNIGQEFQTRVGNSSVNPFTWTRVGAYPRNIHQRIYLKSTKKTFNFSGKKTIDTSFKSPEMWQYLPKVCAHLITLDLRFSIFHCCHK